MHFDYILTELGKTEIDTFIRECKAKRKEIMDAGKDTCDETILPDEEDVLIDIEHFIDEDGEYCNNWGVTDNYDADCPLYLKKGVHFVERRQIMLQIVIAVEGGMVQNVYADNTDVDVKVIDLDVSDYPDDDEIEEKEDNAKKLEEIRKSGDFQCVW